MNRLVTAATVSLLAWWLMQKASDMAFSEVNALDETDLDRVFLVRHHAIKNRDSRK